jgi:hypothetical protein
MVIRYQRKTTKAMRASFTLETRDLQLAGAIYEREDQTKGQYYWNFVGKFPWEVGDYPLPFKVEHKGIDVSYLLYYGVPQGLLRYLFEAVPVNQSKYTAGSFRSCASCLFAHFEQERWEEYYERPISERYADPPASLHTCLVTGQKIDHYNSLESIGSLLTVLKNSLQQNGCEAQTRRAYQVDASLDHTNRVDGKRWVPAEHRRLGMLNDKSIQIKNDTLYLPAGLVIPIQKAI